MKMSLKKKISQILPKIIQTDTYHNYERKTLNNYRLKIMSNKIKIKNPVSPSIKTEVNYYIDKLKISPKNNFGYNSEKTEYSSQINDLSSKINGNSEIKPIFTNIKINDNISQNYKTESNNFYSSPKKMNNNKNKKLIHNFQITSCWYNKIDDFEGLNKFDMENIIKFSSTFLNSKTPKIIKRNKYFPINTKNNKINNRFNSLNCFIDDYIQIDEDKLLNRYYPKYEEYMSKLDFYRLFQKQKNLLTAKAKIKNVFKDIKLIMAMCDYLNSSFSKLKNEKRAKLKAFNKEIEEIKKNKKYTKSIEENIKNNLISKNGLFRMNKKLKNVFKKKSPIIYKNGYFPKSFYFPTSLSSNQL